MSITRNRKIKPAPSQACGERKISMGIWVAL
jgi:hypothetical protein